MAKDPHCPVCGVDLPLAGDERSGEEVYCASCSAPCVLRGDAGDDGCEAAEDF